MVQTSKDGKKTKDLSRTQADVNFNSEGSPLLHPVALLIIKSPCENNIKLRNFIKKLSLLIHTRLHNPLFIAIIQIEQNYWKSSGCSEIKLMLKH